MPASGCYIIPGPRLRKLILRRYNIQRTLDAYSTFCWLSQANPLNRRFLTYFFYPIIDPYMKASGAATLHDKDHFVISIWSSSEPLFKKLNVEPE